jgi:hypothetical protein
LCFLQAKKKTIALFYRYYKKTRKKTRKEKREGEHRTAEITAAELFSGIEEMATRE